MNIYAHMKFAKDHVDKPECYCRIVLWTNECCNETFFIDFFLMRSVMLGERKTLHSKHKNHVPSVKHGGGSIVFGLGVLHLGQDNLPSLME